MPAAAISYTVVALSTAHDRAAFKSGVDALDRYLATQATQDVRRRISGCFVAIETATAAIAGYYTISTSSIPLPEIAPATAKKLPRYPLVPAVRISRLVVDATHKGKGLGAALLFDAIRRTLRADIIAFAVVVDAKDASAAAFYAHHGFIAFVSAPLRLYLPLAGVAKRLGEP
jgi:GNAT superfamily N-acetyltransferase